MYEKQYTKRRTNSQSKIVAFVQFEIKYFHSMLLSHLSFNANTHKKEAGTQNL
jgi:hypothetical protein